MVAFLKVKLSVSVPVDILENNAPKTHQSRAVGGFNCRLMIYDLI